MKNQIKEKLSEALSDSGQCSFKYLSIIITVFAAILLTSNVAAVKLVFVFGITLTGGFIVFPFTYILNTIVVEVYGYKNARMAIWCGFVLSFIFVFFIDIVSIIPPSPHWHLNREFNDILVPENRIILASLISYFVSDFVNSYIMSKQKIRYMGKCLFRRILLSSFFSVMIGVIVFLVLAFYGKMPNLVLTKLIFFAFIKKMLFQVIFFPITSYVVHRLKKIENIDLYDFKTDFTPFSLNNVYDLSAFRIKSDINTSLNKEVELSDCKN